MVEYFDLTVAIYSTDSTNSLSRCVRSCRAQTLPGRSMQLLIMDAPENMTPEASIAGERIKVQVLSSSSNKLDCVKDFHLVLEYSMSHFVVFLNANDFVRNYMFYVQMLYLYDNSESNAVAVDQWLIEQGGDRKVEKRSFVDQPNLSGIMWKKDYLEQVTPSFLKKRSDKDYIFESVEVENLKIGVIPISFLRHSL